MQDVYKPYMEVVVNRRLVDAVCAVKLIQLCHTAAVHVRAVGIETEKETAAIISPQSLFSCAYASGAASSSAGDTGRVRGVSVRLLQKYV